MKGISGIILGIGMMLNMASAQNSPLSERLQNGDVVFIRHKNFKTTSVIPNGKTPYNYAGIVFIEKGIPMVFHANEPVSKTTFDNFLMMADAGEFKVKRLTEPELLTEEVIGTMHAYATAKLNTHYDGKLSLSTDELYNAELIYKIYRQALGIKLTEPKAIGNLKQDAVTLDFLKEAYGDNIVNEKMVVLGDLYHSVYME